MSKLADWIATFDAAKAVLLAIVAVLASWYDLRGQVDLIKQESSFRWQAQEKIDNAQNASIKEIRDEVRDGFKDLKQVVRDNNQPTRARN